MLIKVFGAAVQGIDATLITIEVNSSRGCMFYLVGLPDSAVKESHQRIISALQVNGYRMPTSNIVINMAPADIRKEGAAYDLPLAIGILAASEVIQSDKLERYLLMGELSLDGSLQPIKGALPIAIKARELGFEGMIVPQQNAHEAAVVNNLKVYGVGNIKGYRILQWHAGINPYISQHPRGILFPAEQLRFRLCRSKRAGECKTSLGGSCFGQPQHTSHRFAGQR